MSIIQELARNVLETRFQDFDTETVEQAKCRILDVIGCTIGGANASGCRMLADLVKKWGGAPESTVLVHGGKVPAHQAAMVNSVMCRSFDFEPVGPYVDGRNIAAHVSGTTVPAALAMAEQRAASGRELIAALVVGDDITSRILAASRYSFDVGWDGTGTVNVFGATAIAGRLMKLNEAQLINAFGIALNQMAGSFQGIYDGAHCFKLPMGLAARAGIFSAELAGRGFTGVKDPLLSQNGYFSLYCHGHDDEMMTLDLGKKFFADRTFKPYPACRSTHGVIDGALQIVRGHDIEPDNIEEIIIDVTEVTRKIFVGQPFEIRDVPQIDAAFSLRYNAANILLRKSIKLEHFTEDYVRDPKIAELIGKIRLVSTLPPDQPLATNLEVRMKGGARFTAGVVIPRGDDLYNPLTREEIREKFRTNVAFSRTVPEGKAERALTMIESLDDVKDITEVIKAIG